MAGCFETIYIRYVSDGSGGFKWQFSPDDGVVTPYLDSKVNTNDNVQEIIIDHPNFTQAQKNGIDYTTNSSWFVGAETGTSGIYRIIYSQIDLNNTGSDISATVTAIHPNASLNQVFTIIQKPAAAQDVITITPNTATIPQPGGNDSVTVDSTGAWTITQTSGTTNYFKITPTGGTGPSGQTTVTFAKVGANTLGSPIVCTYDITIDGTSVKASVTVTHQS